MKTFLTILLTIIAISNALEPPKTLKTCKKSDPDYNRCTEAAIQSFISSLASGMESLGVPPLEPLAVDRIRFGEINGSPVSVKQDYRNIKVHGLTKGLTVENYKADFDKLTIYLDIKNPIIEFIADYELDGKVLVLPIRGKGHSNITLINEIIKGTIKMEKYEKDGETYLRVTNYLVKLQPDKVLVDFQNLFDGDKALGDQLNSFLNENSDTIFKEIQSFFEEAFGLIYKDLANKVLSRFPMMTLFPE